MIKVFAFVDKKMKKVSWGIRFLMLVVILTGKSSLVVAETTTFKELEMNVYDVHELTKIGADYESFSTHATKLGLSLGRYKRELNGNKPGAYENLIMDAAQYYIEALGHWRKSLNASWQQDKQVRKILQDTSLLLRDTDINDASDKINEAEKIKANTK